MNTSFPKQKGQTEEIRRFIINELLEAKSKGMSYLDITSGDIHKAMRLSNRMPSVCNAMVSIDMFSFQVIQDTPSGMSSTRVVRYYLIE